MGKKYKKNTRRQLIKLFSEEEIEDMKRIYYIHGKPILALDEKVANEIYMRNYKE